MNIIRCARSQAGITQVDLAKCIEATQGAIGHWERGERKPSVKFAIKIKRFFREKGVNITLDDIYDS